MYRGKFDSKYKGSETTELPQRSPKREEAPVREQPAKQNPRQGASQQYQTRPAASQQTRQAAPQQAPQRQNGRPAPQQAPQRQNGRPAPQQAPQRQAGFQPMPQNPQPMAQQMPQQVRRGPRIGGVIFYTFYFLFIFLFFVGTFFGLQYLRSFLADFEAAQPTAQSQQVFEDLFGNPDWGTLYDMASVEDTPYEGKDEFVAYMEDLVGSNELTMVETSAGLSGGKKYYVRSGDVRVASFTMTDASGAASTDITAIPDWKLGAVEVFFQRTESYRIQKLDGHIATVNGVELDDSFTIQIATTTAEDYLPIDVVGNRTCIQEIGNLMFQPEVKITDENGTAMEVIYDEATRTFVEQTEVTAISDDLKNVAIDACKAYSMYMIEAVGADKVAKYFETTSDVYKMIVRSERWMQDYSDYRFGNEDVTNYVRYSDDLFSAKVSLSLFVTRTNGTVREYKVDDTLFFELQKTGKWLVFDKTNEDVTAPKGQIRLTFMDGDTQVSSEFYDTDSKELTIPVPAAPSGKVFTGWYRKDVNENGTTTATVIFSPDEEGRVSVSGIKLEPMTLYALYQNADEVAASAATSGEA